MGPQKLLEASDCFLPCFGLDIFQSRAFSFVFFNWDSNRRPLVLEGNALPTDLISQSDCLDRKSRIFIGGGWGGWGPFFYVLRGLLLFVMAVPASKNYIHVRIQP